MVWKKKIGISMGLELVMYWETGASKKRLDEKIVGEIRPRG